MLPLVTNDLLFRITGGIQLEGFLNKTDEEGIKAGIKEAIKELISKINSSALILNGLRSSLYLWPKTHASTHPSKLQDDTGCRNILKYVPLEVSRFLKKTTKTESFRFSFPKVINLQIVFELRTPGDPKQTGIVIQRNKMSRIHFKLTLPIDVIVFATPDEPWGKLQDQFLEAVTAQLTAMDQCIQRYTKGKTVPIPQAFHFELPERTILTTIIYPAGISDKVLEPQRKELHAELGLADKPFLRRPMAYHLPGTEVPTDYLKNVHKYVPIPDPDKFKVALVHGFYVFYHLLQEYDNDTEWGAPYRCLQVVISWFHFQGYIESPTPFIAGIQNKLMAIKDKYMHVVIGREWLEPEQILAALNSFNISAIIVDDETNVAKPVDLYAHFEEQGTPVVIYKSVIFSEPKAYILLGVATNEDSSAKQVLMLDTMYTGTDDLAYIIQKAVKWQGKEFWDEMEDFGLCLPQRPEGV
ncbi:ufm1-specific protease 2-like [Scyliorhinus torazame]|uniref:ufm1-specific protease 2-like n=1 Tax=Scyliorhinus torazame TaxID=75743 RepID=UPI003B5B385C